MTHMKQDYKPADRSTCSHKLWIALYSILCSILVTHIIVQQIQFYNLQDYVHRLAKQVDTTEHHSSKYANLRLINKLERKSRRIRSYPTRSISYTSEPTNNRENNYGEAAHFAAYLPPNILSGENKTTTDILIQSANGRNYVGKVNDSGFLPSGTKPTAYRMFKLQTQHNDQMSSTSLVSYTWGDEYAVVKKSGVYLLYAHITYWIKSMTAGYEIQINNNRTLSRCVIQQQVKGRTSSRINAPTPCATTLATYLQREDTITFKPLYAGRRILPNHKFNYWGLVRIPA